MLTVSVIDYIIMRYSDSYTLADEQNGVYSAIFDTVKDTDMAFPLEMGLMNTNNGWKVEYIYTQG